MASSNAQLLAFSNELQAGKLKVLFSGVAFKALSSVFEEELLTVQQQSVMDLAAMQRPLLLASYGAV